MSPRWFAGVVLTLTLVATCSANDSDANTYMPRQHARFYGFHRKIPRSDAARLQRHVARCPRNCRFSVPHVAKTRAAFMDRLEEAETRLVYFRIRLRGYNESILEEYPYMKRSFGASQWVWASGSLGRKLLGLPLDADVLSLYTLATRSLTLNVTSRPAKCGLMLSPECRLHAVRRFLIENVTATHTTTATGRSQRNFLCHRIVNKSEWDGHSRLFFRCCDVSEFASGDHACQIYTGNGEDLSAILTLINLIAVVFTLYSPVFVLRLKVLMTFDTFTKFFRASLKHGITGRRNYVIRISSRQLISLADCKPFSLPRALFRFLFHCYGEGRCCIHCWHQWRHQPVLCRTDACCRRCWMLYWRLIAVLILYPGILYVALGLYLPRLSHYASIVEFARQLKVPLRLHVNLLGGALLPNYDVATSAWLLFSLAAFAYTTLLLSWPNNPLERCLVDNGQERRHDDALYHRLTLGYKAVLQKLVYGEFSTERHLLGIRWAPWGIRRFVRFIARVLMQIPVVAVCASLLAFDSKLFRLRHTEPPADSDAEEEHQIDEAQDPLSWQPPQLFSVCKAMMTGIVWLGFILVLAGYCSIVFVMTEFLLNVFLFTLLGCVLRSAFFLPWLGFASVVACHINDTLWRVNRQHSEILRLIDENSPRISATEDEERTFGDDDSGGVQLLKTHNLGAVKFIDGDNVEYVSKELFYNVCADLRCGWSASLRHVTARLTVLLLFSLFVFLSLSALGSLTGAGVATSLAAVVISLLPKIRDMWRARCDGGLVARRRRHWARLMPDLLDKHVRVDRSRCRDEWEEELSTYDVRPVGQLELDLPRAVSARGLRVWKFPWAVSADQQTHGEPFVVAIANKMAAAAFLNRVVTRAYAPNLQDDAVLRQWCLLVETCIIEGSAAAANINGVPMDSLRLFGRDVQRLVSAFVTGTTIDSVVDAVNRELYGPYTKGVLITIGNTAIAICKLNSRIFAFNSACHADQLSDLFGAVLIATDFNIQNLQTTIKYIIDPYNPDAVPVYAALPTEGYVFRSPDILEAQSP